MYSILATILAFPFIASNALAATTGPGPIIPTTPNTTPAGGVTFTGPFGSDTIESVLGRLTGYVAGVGASVATIMILYGAFQILTSRGNTPQLVAGRKTIIYALGGLVIVILAGALVTLFASLTRSLGI